MVTELWAFLNSRTRPRVNCFYSWRGHGLGLAVPVISTVGRNGGKVGVGSSHAQFTTERQPVLQPAVAFSKTSFKHRYIQIKGNFTKLTLHLYFKCIMYYAGLLFCSVYCQ